MNHINTLSVIRPLEKGGEKAKGSLFSRIGMSTLNGPNQDHVFADDKERHKD
jgi:hypothetical protein